MTPKHEPRSMARTVGYVVLVCLGVRLAAALIEPVLPALLALGGAVFIFSLLFRGPHYRK